MNRCVLVIALLTVFFGQSVPAQNLDVYFGLLHSHTSFSDGLGTPNEAYQSAKEAGLDFMAITEHNHSQAAGSDGIFLTPTNYLILRQSAESHTSADFVAIFGQEVSSISKGNHVNVFFADEICDIATHRHQSMRNQKWGYSKP